MKSKDQLLEILFDKGNKRKRALYDATVHQTNDWSNTQKSLNDMRAQLNNVYHQKQAYLDSLSQNKQDVADLNNRIGQLDSEIVGKTGEASMQQTGNTNEFKEQMSSAVDSVTPDMLKQLNKLLENESPKALVVVLEHFVALLRNKSNTKNADVELFMKDCAKLVAKM